MSIQKPDQFGILIELIKTLQKKQDNVLSDES